MELIMLGTGNATVTRCYNTCFVLQEGQSGFLVDAGGGNGILRQMELAGIRLDSIHSMYITHAHTDHILGAIWVVRMDNLKSTRTTSVFRYWKHVVG